MAVIPDTENRIIANFINKYFVNDILEIFNEDSHVEMIGVTGAKNLFANGVWWESQDKYGKIYDNHTGKMQLINFAKFSNKYQEIDCIDGLIMTTQYDIPGREDIFTGWHFYDLSQSMEFKKALIIVCWVLSESIKNIAWSHRATWPV